MHLDVIADSRLSSVHDRVSRNKFQEDGQDLHTRLLILSSTKDSAMTSSWYHTFSFAWNDTFFCLLYHVHKQKRVRAWVWDILVILCWYGTYSCRSTTWTPQNWSFLLMMPFICVTDILGWELMVSSLCCVTRKTFKCGFIILMVVNLRWVVFQFWNNSYWLFEIQGLSGV